MAERNNKKRKSAEESLPFEKALERLEEIVTDLESGELTLDESLTRYEDGRSVIGRCYKLLENAERRIEELVKGEDGELSAQPFGGGVPDPEADT